MIEWENYRERCFQAKGEQCHFCDATDDIVAHHINGDREDHRLENLIPVCLSCHRNIHSRNDKLTEWSKKLPDSAMQGSKPHRETDKERDDLTVNKAAVRGAVENYHSLFRPDDTKSDVLSKLARVSNRFTEFIEDVPIDDLHIKNPRAQDYAVIVVEAHEPNREWAVLSFEGEFVFVSPEGSCGCGATVVFEESPNNASNDVCNHGKAVMNAITIRRPRKGVNGRTDAANWVGCPACGFPCVEEQRRYDDEGFRILSAFLCVKCGRVHETATH